MTLRALPRLNRKSKQLLDGQRHLEAGLLFRLVTREVVEILASAIQLVGHHFEAAVGLNLFAEQVFCLYQHTPIEPQV